MTSTPLAHLSVHERILLSAERFPWNAIYRIAIGYWMLPLFLRLSTKDDLGWSLLLWFVALLLTIRLLTAVLRKLLPFSKEVAAAWAERRLLAKRFDSYQWQKLFWFGAGLAAYTVSSGQSTWPVAALTAFCLIGGALGFLVWRHRVFTGVVSAAR